LEIHLTKSLLKTTDAAKHIENNSHLQYLAGLGPRTQSYAPVPIVYAAETPSFFLLKSQAGSLSHVIGRLVGLLAVEIIGIMLALALMRKIPGITVTQAAVAGFILFNIIPILGFMFPGRFYNPSQPQDPGKPAIVVDEMFNRSRLIEQLELWLSKS